MDERTSKRPVLVHITTVPLTVLAFLVDQLNAAAAAGYEVHVITSPGPELSDVRARCTATVHTVAMHRGMSPARDVASLARLVATLRRIRPHIVHAHTPKAGFLGMLAATIACVPARVYTVHGLAISNHRTFIGRVVAVCDLLACRLAGAVIAVSPSLRVELGTRGIVPIERVVVSGSGSVDGVDAAERFNPARWLPHRVALREQLGIPASAWVLGFVGRLSREKGLTELAGAWRLIREDVPGARLLIVGAPDERDPLDRTLLDEWRADARVTLVGHQQSPERFYAIMDCLVLPTHREGLGMAALEAAAMGIPVVASRVCGCVDAVADGETGTLVPVHAVEPLAEALRAYASDAARSREHGRAGRRRALVEFRPAAVREWLFDVYTNLNRPGIAKRQRANGIYRSYVKRGLDVAVSAAGLLLLAPVLVLIGAVAAHRLGSPVLFLQKRPGRGGRAFEIVKFRTMTDLLDRDGVLLPDAQRLTRFGQFLRASSLDELPELWNVLKGDMSLIGPRPLLTQYLDRYTPAQARRHEVRPGITGLAQVSGRNALSWEQKFDLDVWYVDHCSFWLDVKILALTFWNVVARRDINQPGHATAQEFTGSAGR